MFTKFKVCLLIGCFLFIASTAVAAPFWQFQVGTQATFSRTDSLGTSWNVTLAVVGTQTFGSTEYYHLTETNYDNNAAVHDIYMRSTATAAYIYNETAAAEFPFFQAAPEGTTWNHPTGADSTRYYEIVSKTDHGNVYVVRAYDVENGVTRPIVYDHFVRGIGMVKEVDYWVTNAPTTMKRNGFSGNTLYTTFPGYGLYSYDYEGTTTWTKINTITPATMVASGSNLYGTFTGYGLYKWDGTSWNQMTTLIPANMVAAGSILYVDFAGYGLYKWDGTSWNQISPLHPAYMVASSSLLYVNFAEYGTYKYDGTGWSRLTTLVPTNMLAP
jgi:hypothetical protein